MCVSVFVQRRGRFALGLSLLKSYTSGLVIWKGCCTGQTNTDRERGKEEEEEGRFYRFRAHFSINLSLPCVDSVTDTFPSTVKSAKAKQIFKQMQT